MISLSMKEKMGRTNYSIYNWTGKYEKINLEKLKKKKQQKK